jgi:Dockerin type I domain
MEFCSKNDIYTSYGIRCQRSERMGLNKAVSTLVLGIFVVNIFTAIYSVQQVRGSVGPNLDVYSDRGGVGPSMPCDSYYLAEKMVLFANATYSDWPESQRDVAFQIIDPNRATVAILYSRTDEFGIASVNWTLPRIEGELFGNWTIVGTVNIEGVAVFDTLPFQYRLHEHVVQVTSLITAKSICGQGFPLILNVSLFNLSNTTAECYLTVFANDTVIVNQTQFSVSGHDLGIFTYAWNTSDFAFGNYTLTAYAEPVPGSICADSVPAVNWIVVTIMGDVNGDFQVDIFDALLIARSFCSTLDCALRNPNADINNDDVVDIYDAMLLASNYGKSARV